MPCEGSAPRTTPSTPAARKLPFVSKDQLLRIAEQYPTPFHLYDEAGIRATAQALNDAFAWNPGFREFYAVKACPNPAIIGILREYGCGLDCATATELLLAQRMGVPGQDLMFSSNATPAADYRLAASLGATINFDDAAHLPFYEAEVGALPQVVSLRYNPGPAWTAETTEIFDTPSGSKFGMTHAQLLQACHHLADAGRTQFGVHALLSSNTLGTAYYPRLARELFDLVVRAWHETGLRPAFVNLSGGVGIAYRPEDEQPDIAAIGQGVREAYEDVLVAAGLTDVAIYTELGRYMTGPHGCLVTRVLHEKPSYHNYLGVDACAADLFRPALYGAYHHITVVGQAGGPDKIGAEPTRTYDVVGGLCENNDRFANGRALPQADPGDLLVIHDTGAHGRSMGYNYNGRLRSAEVLLRPDGSTRLIRRAETPADYFATLDVLGDEFPMDG